MKLIAPSILSADILNLEKEILALEQAGADQLHIDVMDGHFVPNLTMGPMFVRAIKNIARVPHDVHLMISNASDQIKNYIEAGADLLTIHQETSHHLERDIKEIKTHNIKAGVALNPGTHEHALKYVIDMVDLILVMSVNPGFSGQSFLPTQLKKITAIKAMLEQAGNTACILSVDGGINSNTAQACNKAGATCLVSGSYIFASENYEKAIKSLRQNSTI